MRKIIERFVLPLYVLSLSDLGIKQPSAIKIFPKMSTDEGVQKVCKGIPASISKYHLEAPLYPYLKPLLSIDHSTTGETPSNTPNPKLDFIFKTIETLDMSTKVELLQKIARTVAVQTKKLEKRLSEVNGNPPSPLSTHTGESTCSSLLDEPKMEEMEPLFPFEDPCFPLYPLRH